MMQIASTCKGCSCDKCNLFTENIPSDGKLNQATDRNTNNHRTPEKCQNPQPSRHRTFARSRASKARTRCAYGAGNHHRLDHTYAAANTSEVSRSATAKPAEQPAAADSGKDETTEKTSARDREVQPRLAEERRILSPVTESNGGGEDSNAGVLQTPRGENGADCPPLGSTRYESKEEINLKSTWLRNLCLEYQPAKNLLNSQARVDDVGSDSADVSRDKRKRFQFSGLNGTLKQYQRNRKVGKNKAELSSTFLGKSKVVKTVQEDKKRWIAALALMELAESK